MLRRGVMVLIAGCGRLGFDPGSPMDAAAVPDAPDALPPTGPFGAPIPVTSINTAAAEDDFTLTADHLEVFFDSSRTGTLGGGDIWTATRASPTDAWNPATNVSDLNTTGDDATPEVSRDGLTLYWVSAGAAGAKDVYMATRPDRTSPWGARTRIVELSSAADESGTTITPDGLMLYLSRDPTGTDDMFVSQRMGAAWTTPVPVTGLNAAGFADAEPFINGSNTLILWSSDRGGNRDLWMARRATSAEAWAAPQPIGELNTTGAEGDPWLSADEHTLYFTRDTDIFIATR